MRDDSTIDRQTPDTTDPRESELEGVELARLDTVSGGWFAPVIAVVGGFAAGVFCNPGWGRRSPQPP